MRAKRRPVDDELVVDGELVLLVNATVVVLSKVATAALDHLVTDSWTSLGELTHHLESAVGLPDEGSAAVRELLAALEAGGLVTVEQ